jgi:hypothetical protein
MATTNIGLWQQGKDTGKYDNGGDNGPPSSPAVGEDNNTAASNNWGNVTPLWATTVATRTPAR